MSRSAPTLVVDIGNTSTSIGVRSGRRISNPARIDTGKSTPKSIRSLLRKCIEGAEPERVVMATVVPSAKAQWGRAVLDVCGIKPLWVTHRLNLGVEITYPEPRTIGADRLANACWAAHRYGTPVVVADFGTALTFDIVKVDKGYVGGIIVPGLPLMLDYLAERTAQLPHIEPAPVRGMVGKSTEQAMQIGARYGYRGMVREILDGLRKDLQAEDLLVCATGGYAKWVLRGLSSTIRFAPNLTLLGLGRIGDLNPA